ncbi:MAG: DNA polymerase III subunit gamma/tau, partial [Nitrospinota bacterium]
MTYQVTARKYRPQTFADLIGQDHIRRTLQNALKRDRVAHAYIFSGPRGVGKTTVARLLAKAVNCERRSAAAAGGEALPDEPCNECSSCREIVEDRHPDVLEIDGASNTGVDNVRDLREQVRYAPARGRCKVYVIDEVHMLSKGAFNALLKTLEEPPPGVLFVFATTEPERIPATIASRCQCFDFHRLSPAVIAAHLTRIAEGEGRAVDRAAIQLLARTAEGSMRDAQSLFDQVVAFAAGREDDGPLGEAEVSEVLGLVAGSVLWKVARMIARDDAPGLLEVARGIFQEGQDVKQFCLSLMGFLRDLRVAEGVEDPAGLLDLMPEEMEELRALAKETREAADAWT